MFALKKTNHPTFFFYVKSDNFCLFFLDHSDHELLLPNRITGRAEEPGGQCGEKDQRDLWTYHGKKTVDLYG